jgi:hypothetical protein
MTTTQYSAPATCGWRIICPLAVYRSNSGRGTAAPAKTHASLMIRTPEPTAYPRRSVCTNLYTKLMLYTVVACRSDIPMYNLSRVLRHQIPPLDTRGFWRHHVSHDIRPRLPARDGSGVTTCPTVSHLPPGTGGLWHRHVLRSVRPCFPMRESSGVVTCPIAPGPHSDEGGLWCHHMSHGSKPTSRHGRAPASQRTAWFSLCYGPQAKKKY